MSNVLTREQVVLLVSDLVNGDVDAQRGEAQLLAHDVAFRQAYQQAVEINAKHVLNAIEITGQFADLRAENARLSELLWGSRCVYCGEVVGKDQQNQDVADEVLRKHVLACPQHPAAELKAQLQQAVEALRALHDEQNGAPLFKYERAWNDAMNLAQAVFATHKEKG